MQLRLSAACGSADIRNELLNQAPMWCSAPETSREL
jgi:hypothetical protein